MSKWWYIVCSVLTVLVLARLIFVHEPVAVFATALIALGTGSVIVMQRRVMKAQAERIANLLQAMECDDVNIKRHERRGIKMEQVCEEQLQILGEAIGVVYRMNDVRGADLKHLRFRLLDAAMMGFKSLGRFTWFHDPKVDPGTCRDYAAQMIATTDEDMTQSWVANFIRFSHGGKSVSSRSDESRPISNRPAAPSM